MRNLRSFGFLEKKKYGFTLIEILVVISIIGVLSSVVMASISKVKTKALDVAVKANLNAAREQAQIYYEDQSPNGYASATFGENPCPQIYDPSGTNLFTQDAVVSSAIVAAIAKGNGISACYASATAYGIAVGLKTAGYAWCVDSTGNTSQFPGAPGTVLVAGGVCQ